MSFLEKASRVCASVATTDRAAVDNRLLVSSNAQLRIAAALHYSPRSIEVYLSRIYAKLRVSSRLELARALDAMDSTA